MELRPLAYFVVTCLQSSLGRAAAALGLAPSTLSASLRALEAEVGLPLFRRLGAGLEPTASARWLYRAAVPLLHAEAFARRHVSAGSRTPGHLVLRLQPSFTFGRITKAVAGAIEAVAATDTFVEPSWSAADGPGLVIRYADEGEAGRAMLEDPIVLARASPGGAGEAAGAEDLLRGPVLVPALPPPLLRLLRRVLDGRDATFLDEEPGALPRLAAERPDAAFAVPASLLSERLGWPGSQAVPLGPSTVAHIVAHGDDGPLARAIVDAIRARLAAPDVTTIFRPALTLRGLRAFKALERLRRVTAAARSLGIAQPAVTEALRRMETALGVPLYERRRDGLLPTPAGTRLRDAAGTLARLEHDLVAGRAAAPGDRGGRLTLGLPPTAGPDDPLATGAAAALVAWRAAHPGVQLSVMEAPSAGLHALLREGVLDLAVAEWAPPHVARLSLAPAEPLVAGMAPARAAGLAGTGAMSGTHPAALGLGTLAGLPLALPPPAHGVRRVLAAAFRAAGLVPISVAEVASPGLALALARADAAVAVLPLSAFGAEVTAGRLVVLPLATPHAERSLVVLHGGERPLTTAERALVGALRAALRPARGA